jgi:hypothetical protein
VRQLANEMAVLATVAGTRLAAAEQALREPEGKPLLPDSGVSVQEDAGRKRAPVREPCETLSQSVMSVEIHDCHTTNMARFVTEN